MLDKSTIDPIEFYDYTYNGDDRYKSLIEHESPDTKEEEKVHIKIMNYKGLPSSYDEYDVDELSDLIDDYQFYEKYDEKNNYIDALERENSDLKSIIEELAKVILDLSNESEINEFLKHKIKNTLKGDT